jgi:type IV pilus assembly protein PilC
VTINLIRAAETGGTLEDTLTDIVATTKKDLVFSDNLRTTMIYPAFVMVVFLGIVILMLTFVIPRVAKVFDGMRVHIPPITRAMISASNAFTSHYVLIIAAFIAIVVGISVLVSMNRKVLIRILLGLPGLRKLGHNIDFTRFTRSLALLMHAGVPLEDALQLSERVVQNKEIMAVIHQMRHNVVTGNKLSKGLRDYGNLIPPIMTRSIETAESSGTLEKTMQNLAEYFDGQVTESLKAVSSLVEPVLLIVVGIMVGTLMVTIIAPIYNLISQINPKNT